MNHIELTGTFSCRHCNKSLSIKFMLRRILKSECPKCRAMHHVRIELVDDGSPYESVENFRLSISYSLPTRAQRPALEPRQARRILRDKVAIAQSRAIKEREALKLLAEQRQSNLDNEMHIANYEAAMLEMDKAMAELKAELKQKRLPN